jgi:aminoglycoside 6'-N-acetyltransferase
MPSSTPTEPMAPEVWLRPLRDHDDDYALLLRWLTDPRVLEWYEGRDQVFTLDRLRREWAPAVQVDEWVWPFVIVADARPVGYLQVVQVLPYATEYAVDGDAANTWAIDLFVGEPDEWGRGVGTAAVREGIAETVRRGADRVVIDPRVTNHRAVHVYEKVGFRRVKVLPGAEFHEGQAWDCWLMELVLPHQNTGSSSSST